MSGTTDNILSGSQAFIRYKFRIDKALCAKHNELIKS